MMELDDIRSGVGFFKEVVNWVQSLIDKEKRKYLGAIFSNRQTDEDAGGRFPGPRLFLH